MKKLMIAAAIVCAAVASQAATVAWMSMSTEEGIPVDVTAFVDKSTGNPYETMPANVQIVLATITGDLAGDFTVGNVFSVGELDPSSGSMVMGGFDQGYGTEGFPIKNGDVVAAVAAITDNGETTYKALEYYGTDNKVTDSFTVSGLSDDSWYQEFYFGTQGNYTVTLSNVPEPTSGLLLLLGVAGLALRRRRA